MPLIHVFLVRLASTLLVVFYVTLLKNALVVILESTLSVSVSWLSYWSMYTVYCMVHAMIWRDTVMLDNVCFSLYLLGPFAYHVCVTFLEGAAYTSDLLNIESPTYKKWQANLTAEVIMLCLCMPNRWIFLGQYAY